MSNTATIGMAAPRAVAAGTDAGQAQAVVQRRQDLQRLDRVDDRVIDERQRDEARTAVHDAVADGLDRSGAPGQLERVLDGRGVIPLAHGLGALGQCAAGGGWGAGLDRHQAELHRRRPTVQRQHVHLRIPGLSRAMRSQR